jgi:hypothetical protein
MLRNRGERTVRKNQGRTWRPNAESLETRALMAIDLSLTAGPAPGPYGVAVNGSGLVGSDYGANVSIVGDVNNDGFQDFAIANPFQGRVQLIFGSQPADYLTLTNADRAINASSILVDSGAIRGISFFNPTQVNPSTGLSNFGSSISPAGDVNGDGIADFLIGDSGALDINNTAGTNGAGKAYLVYGRADFLSIGTSSIDIENAFSTFGIRTLTLATTATTGNLGTSVSSAGNVFQETRPALAVGADRVTLGGLANNGAVYVVPNSIIPNPASTGAATINVANIGQTGSTGLAGIVLVGTESNGETGFSAGYTDIDNDGITDVMLGSPGITGMAHIVYGTSALLGKNTTLTGGTTRGVSLARVGTTDVPGVVVVGGSDRTGNSVSFGGDFNGDGRFDMLIGSPNFGGSSSVPVNAGRVTLFYGNASSSRYNGTISLDSPTGLQYAQFIGEVANAFTGDSVSATGYVNTDNYSEILFGAPGFGSGVGRAYLLPGNPGLYGVISLVGSETNNYLKSQVFTTSASNVRQVGGSVSGFWRARTPSRPTVDNDNLADVLIGAPGGTQGGAGYLLEGSFIPLQTPDSNVIITQIGVDTLPTNPQPYDVNGASTAPLDIYVLSVATLPGGGSFAPLTDIVTGSIVVNGVAFPNATIQPSVPADINNDGIPDALIQVSPRSSLFKTNGLTTVTITGTTTSNRIWQGSATVTVFGLSGGSDGPFPTPPASPLSIRFDDKYNPPVLGERTLPTAQSLSNYNWKPLRYREAYQQFIPGKYWQLRAGILNGTAAKSNVQAVLNHRRNLDNRNNPINGHRSVFMRDYTYPGIKVNHKVPTIPIRSRLLG